VNIKTPVCQIIGPAAAGSAGPVPTPAELALLLLAAAKLVKVVIACDLLGFFSARRRALSNVAIVPSVCLSV